MVLLHNFSKIKSQKAVQNSINQGFSYYFLLNDRRIQEAQKHGDLVDPDPDSDPDPQQWLATKAFVFLP
jgi:hypothetical protein